jgi:TolB-like protein
VRYFFGDCQLDTERRQLRRGDSPVALEPQVFDLLVCLLQNRDRVLSKDDLLARVWGGRIVSDATIDSRIQAARRAIGDSGAAQGLIRTFVRKGVRFVATVAADEKNTAFLDSSEEPSALRLPNDRPSIAVLRFQNLSGDPEQAYFADGMVEEIITALSRIRWLFVIAHNSSFTNAGQRGDATQVGSEIGVRYVLEGSVRRAGGRVRITAQLIDATTGACLWADGFEGCLEDVFDLQDKVATSVAGVIEPTVQAAEIARCVHRPTSDFTSYDAYLRAYSMVFASATEVPQALRLLERAITRDPDFGPALAWAAVCCIRLSADGTSQDRETDKRKGIDFARRAIQVAPDDPGTLANAAYALAYFGEDIDAMMALTDRALSLNPNNARSWFTSSFVRLWAGHLDLAIEHAKTAQRLSPRGRIGVLSCVIGFALFLNRHFEEAVPALLLAIQEQPTMPLAYRCLAACYAHMGRLDEAREIFARRGRHTPVVVPKASALRNSEHRQLMESGLRLALGQSE